jgi:hypothetical protein
MALPRRRYDGGGRGASTRENPPLKGRVARGYLPAGALALAGSSSFGALLVGLPAVSVAFKDDPLYLTDDHDFHLSLGDTGEERLGRPAFGR